MEKLTSIQKIFCVTLIFTIILIKTSSCESTDGQVLLYSIFSWGKLQGNVTFSWRGPGTNVSIEVSLEHTDAGAVDESEEFDWAIHELPVRFDRSQRCEISSVGKKFLDLSSFLGKLTLPTSGKIYETDQLNLVGEKSIWGRSFRIIGSKISTCGNIQGVGGEETFESRFFAPVGGSIWFRTWTWHVAPSLDGAYEGDSGTEIVIIADVFNTFGEESTSSAHEWNLYITDILDEESKEFRSSCNFLTTVYDFVSQNVCQDDVCSFDDFTTKFGKLSVPSSRSRVSTKLYHSSGKPLLNLSGARQLYVGIEDAILNKNVYACARLRPIKSKKAKAIFSSDGVLGEIHIEQASVFVPTELTLDLHNLREIAGGFNVHELPFKAPMKPGQSTCGETLGHYNPYSVDPKNSPAPGTGSHDQYELGDLSGKHGMLLGVDSLSATVIDHNLPLFGPRSVIGRSIVIHKGDDGSRWICSNLRVDGTQLIRTVATFRYPLVGEIIMEQEMDDPFADTTVIVGPLLYSDGSHNDTSNHDWFINENIPDKDFYNWTQRCVSAGPHYNPYKIATSKKVYDSCGIDNAERCEVGDMSGRNGPVNVAGSTHTALKARKVFTDINLPLSGPHNVLQHSFVIEDRDAPKHRGNRLACTGIFRRFRYKGVVNKWQSSDRESDVTGHIEFIQDTPYDITNTEVDIQGLKRIASGYHVHMVPVLNDLAFPCAASSLYGHFNPLNISDPSAPGTDTDDRYEIGDLSGKYGTLDGKSWNRDVYNDTNLPLFGINSILGRSVLIHKSEQSERWFCGSIGWGYAPSEARQIAAIASFHHPQGFAWGYVRLRQLVYNDGSLSETSIEINLRHPGNNNKNITREHNWSVFVNPVGVDAAVKFLPVRCVAAGYRWNPFLIQLAHPNDRDYYDKQCTPEYPLRCDAGDLSGRLGPIDIGDKRYVFMDSNLPLAGEHNAMGKAIVVHNERGRVENFACANILPDEDIVKWANVRRTGRFSESTFMYDMRKMLNAPEWFLAIDYQTIKNSADRQCVTFKIFFMGPYARELELDFSRLLAGGILEKPTIEIPGTYPDPKRDKKVSYRACGGLEDEDLDKLGSKGKKWWDITNYQSSTASNSLSIWLISFCLPLLLQKIFNLIM